MAVGTVPDSNGVINACLAVTNGAPITTGANVTVIDPSAGQSCAPAQQSIAWNVTGPQGAPGQNGSQGAPGQNGSQGAPGQNGSQGPPGQSGTLTLGSPTVKTSAPGIGLVTFGSRKGAWSFPLLSYGFASTKVGGTTVHDMTVSKVQDSASPRLHLAVAAGTIFPLVRIFLYKTAGGHLPFLIIKLQSVMVSAIQVNSTNNGLKLLETLTLSFAKFTKVYIP